MEAALITVAGWLGADAAAWREPTLVGDSGGPDTAAALDRARPDTFGGDVLRPGRVERLRRPSGALPAPGRAELQEAGAGLVVLPDEPYEVTTEDDPDCFPGLPVALVSGRHSDVA